MSLWKHKRLLGVMNIIRVFSLFIVMIEKVILCFFLGGCSELVLGGSGGACSVQHLEEQRIKSRVTTRDSRDNNGNEVAQCIRRRVSPKDFAAS
jgi:hypothetical protein